MHRLLAIAAEFGLRAQVATITPGVRGYIDHAAKTIYISRRLTPVEMLCTFAHELGHYFHGHECSGNREEDQANNYACRALITPEAYAAAEMLSPHIEVIAEELGVTVEMVEYYQRFALQKLGARTWARAAQRTRKAS